MLADTDDYDIWGDEAGSGEDVGVRISSSMCRCECDGAMSAVLRRRRGERVVEQGEGRSGRKVCAIGGFWGGEAEMVASCVCACVSVCVCACACVRRCLCPGTNNAEAGWLPACLEPVCLPTLHLRAVQTGATQTTDPPCSASLHPFRSGSRPREPILRRCKSGTRNCFLLAERPSLLLTTNPHYLLARQ